MCERLCDRGEQVFLEVRWKRSGDDGSENPSKFHRVVMQVQLTQQLRPFHLQALTHTPCRAAYRLLNICPVEYHGSWQFRESVKVGGNGLASVHAHLGTKIILITEGTTQADQLRGHAAPLRV